MLSSTVCRRSNDTPTAVSTESTAFLTTVPTTSVIPDTTTEHHTEASAESETTNAFVTEASSSDVLSPVSTASTAPAPTEAFLTESTNADTRTRNPDKEPLPKALPENREQQFTLLVEGKAVLMTFADASADQEWTYWQYGGRMGTGEEVSCRGAVPNERQQSEGTLPQKRLNSVYIKRSYDAVLIKENDKDKVVSFVLTQLRYMGFEPIDDKVFAAFYRTEVTSNLVEVSVPLSSGESLRCQIRVHKGQYYVSYFSGWLYNSENVCPFLGE